MLIKKIKVNNFRSFKELNIELNKFNVLVGANASGKSNFISIFNFLRNLVDYGIEDAISLSGGVEYLKNIYISNSDLISIEIEMILERDYLGSSFFLYDDETSMTYNTKSFVYKLELEIKEDSNYELLNEFIKLDVDFKLLSIDELESFYEEVYFDDDDSEYEEEYIGSGEILISKIQDKLKIELTNIKSSLEDNVIRNAIFSGKDSIKTVMKRKTSIFHHPWHQLIDLNEVKYSISDIFSYNINPIPLKNFSTISGKSELESDGKNLILILKRILNDDNKKERLSEIIKDVLPFIEGFSIEKLADKYIYATINEIYSKEKSIPSFLISDGTINIVALIIILFFEKKSITIIEEPERNIHPYLISKIIDLMKDVSSRLGKQIIITTHNPEIVKYSGIDNLLLIQRNEKGFSTIFKPSNSKEIQTFLKNDMGLDEIFVQNLLK